MGWGWTYCVTVAFGETFVSSYISTTMSVSCCLLSTYERGLISRKASVFSLSKSFIEGMSPIHRCEHLHLGFNRLQCSVSPPLMILQKMQLAAMLTVTSLLPSR